MQYTIIINSTATTISNLSLIEMLSAISEHLATVGWDNEAIMVLDSQTAEILEILAGDKLHFNYQIYIEKLHQSYNINQLLEIIPYL